MNGCKPGGFVSSKIDDQGKAAGQMVLVDYYREAGIRRP
jgi:hypothetical protein